MELTHFGKKSTFCSSFPIFRYQSVYIPSFWWLDIQSLTNSNDPYHLKINFMNIYFSFFPSAQFHLN